MGRKRKRKYIPRKTLDFQMDLRSKLDLEIIAIYEQAAANRAALQLFRDGMRLAASLQSGDLSVLFSLYPNLEAHFTPQPDYLIEQFRQMLQSQPAVIAAPQLSAGLKAMKVPEIAMPVFDESEVDEVVIRRDTKAPDLMTNNFMDSVMGLQSKGAGDDEQT